MELQEIDVFVAPDGSVSIEVRGIKGPGCLELTKALEAALGNQITARELRPEAGEAVGEQVAGQFAAEVDGTDVLRPQQAAVGRQPVAEDLPLGNEIGTSMG